MAKLKDIIYLSQEQYNTLITDGTITVDDITLTYNENSIYATPDTLTEDVDNLTLAVEGLDGQINNISLIVGNLQSSLESYDVKTISVDGVEVEPDSNKNVNIDLSGKVDKPPISVIQQAVTIKPNSGDTEGIGFALLSHEAIFGRIPRYQNPTWETAETPPQNMGNLVTADPTKPLHAVNKRYVDDIASSLSGQNEYIGSYDGSDYTAETIQTVLSDFVQTTESRAARNGDIINIVNGIYGGQQWRYSGETSTWKYYIDFENHSVINNLTSTSTTDGLSAAQGKVLNDKITTANGEISRLSQESSDNTEQIEFLQDDMRGKTNVTFNNVHQDYVNFTSDPQTQINTNASNISLLNTNKADQSTTYTKAETNSLLNAKQNTLVADKVQAGVSRDGQHDTVMTSYISSDGNTWYRIWRSGWKECGMRYSSQIKNDAKTFTFPIEFSNNSYVVVATGQASDSGYVSGGMYIRKAATTSVQIGTTATYPNGFRVYCCGY